MLESALMTDMARMVAEVVAAAEEDTLNGRTKSLLILEITLVNPNTIMTNQQVAIHGIGTKGEFFISSFFINDIL